MPQDALSGPDLTGAVADANAVGLEYVVIGGFSVIFHGYAPATKDSDLLVPDGPDSDAAVLRFLERIDARRFRDDKELSAEDVAGAEHLRVSSRHGIIRILRDGLPPLDYETVSERAETAEWNGQTVRVAALPGVVGFKRLAARPQDQVDLAELEAIHGELPIPGLDS
jgi:hypothetical protein